MFRVTSTYSSRVLVALSYSTSFLRARRSYALSRFPGQGKPVGSGRRQLPYKRPRTPSEEPTASAEWEGGDSTEDNSRSWQSGQIVDDNGSEDGLRKLLANNILVVERQIEMLNVFIGFEQTNKYSISNIAGEQVGYIAEEPGSFLSSFNRQLLATHRPFRALVMDPAGVPILLLRRPFAWINSRMFVQRPNPGQESTTNHEPILDTFAEVQQIWHPFRRKYELFLREDPKRILSLASEPQPEPEPASPTFAQIGKVDAPFLSWDFSVHDAASQEMAFVSRTFRGFGREIFTDTGQYFVNFGTRPQVDADGNLLYPNLKTAPQLSLEERALFLALAVNIDFDYFSRHSGPGHGGFFHFGGWD